MFTMSASTISCALPCTIPSPQPPFTSSSLFTVSSLHVHSSTKANILSKIRLNEFSLLTEINFTNLDNTFCDFPNNPKTIGTGTVHLLYYKLQCVNYWNNVFKWFYEICTGCKIDLNTVTPLLQLSLYTGKWDSPVCRPLSDI